MPKHSELHDIDKLIEMVKNRPAIYDYLYTEHKSKEHIDSLWREIGDALNMTPALCKNKWLALRNSYSREIRNEKEANKCPYGKRRRRKWYLSEDMAFLRKFLNYGHYGKRGSRSSYGDEQSEVENDITSVEDETCSSLPIVEKAEIKLIPKEEIEDELDSAIPSQSTEAFESVQQQTPPSTPAAANPIEDPFKEHSYPPKTNRQEDVNVSELQEQNMTFFRSILPDILKLSERRQRLFKQEVLSVLNNSLDEQEMGS